ncbi:glycine cleavage system aminomethyltransferase GcvT [Cerasicoccus arenae]|uniref:Aminomethyltransferase n=1 Tax=Cerasicoccus arenae TaxID=424488 RepID=A0A8J3DCS3_9BACT|nr:glycine cleavage system aminomethyltransferase GcvT [Cerasicoccus arenae]MBK1858816.1 glycine cleavage system aminomethyltransferase GcvT [Cerasicoccus arenae]GHC04435.1 aminomethyltransferase [Cerasicoccus arenae]
MSELQHTPLYGFHLDHGARLVPFAGWEMPVQYVSILEEHVAVRERAGLFDVSHMGEALVTGPDAETFLDYLLPNKIAGTPIGKGVYSPMCHPSGGVVDDLIVYRLRETEFLLCLNASNTKKDLDWINAHKGSYDCTIEDVSAAYAQLALQGPKAIEILNLVAEPPTGKTLAVKRFRVLETELAGIPCLICGTGYTGEGGVEIYCHQGHARQLADTILEAGQPLGLALCGLGSRDSLRLEAGLPLYGHELGDDITPTEGGVGWTVKLNKPGDFIGKQALVNEQANGPKRQLIFFTMNDRRIARAETPVFTGDTQVGVVVSGTQSPILNCPIGSALIAADADLADLTVDIRGKRIPLTIKAPPLHR